MGLVAALPLQRLVKGDTALQRKVQCLHMANEGAEDRTTARWEVVAENGNQILRVSFASRSRNVRLGGIEVVVFFGFFSCFN